MKKILPLIVIITLLVSCDHHKRSEKKTSGDADTLLKTDTSDVRNEIRNIDKDFSAFSESNGIKDAIEKYMGVEGVLLKTNHLPVVSKDSVVAFFSKKKFQNFKILRTPAYIDVSKSADLAYVYGTYDASGTTPKGNLISSKGSYVSIWKKNTEGSWELVLDSENEGLVPVAKKK